MRFPIDIPGYVQGHRFSDDPMFYDSAKERFTDLSGGDRYDRYVSKVSGTPVFADRGPNNRRGLYLDNTNQWVCPYPIPWCGSGILVASYNTVDSGSGIVYTHIFGDATIDHINNDPAIFTQFYFGTRRLYLWGGYGQLTHYLNIGDDTIVVMAWSRDQEDRKSRLTQDGVTVDVIGPYASYTNTGEFISMGERRTLRLGNVTGDITSTAVSTQGTAHIFEQHFFKTNILRDYPTLTQEVLSNLRSYYGVV